MARPAIKYALMFLGLVLIQVLFLNQVQFSGFVNPYIYILFIFLLPVNAPRYALLLLAFLMGLTIDVFSNSLGMHAFASVLIAYLRPLVIRVVSSREEDISEYPGLKQNKVGWFLGYITLLTIIHHMALFFLEVFSFQDFSITLLRSMASVIFSVFIIVLSQLLVFRE